MSILIIRIVQISILLFICGIMCFFCTSCSDLTISSFQTSSLLQCDPTQPNCNHKGNTALLNKKPLDVVLVLNNHKDESTLNPHTTTNLNKFLTCIDGVVDWNIGIISSVQEDPPSKNFGQLMNLEIKGPPKAPLPEIDPNTPQYIYSETTDTINTTDTPQYIYAPEIQSSTNSINSANKKQILIDNKNFLVGKKIITPDMTNYDIIFSDTISLKSGCENPPYCYTGDNKPLKSIKTFMEQELNDKRPFSNFLRKDAQLAVIVVSPSDESTDLFSTTNVSAQDLTNLIYNHYPKEKFISFTVTDPKKESDCLYTGGEFIATAVNKTTDSAMLYGMVAHDPLVIIATSLVKSFFTYDPNANEITQFAKNTKGYVFDICKPSFGNSLAYSVLQRMSEEDKFSDECKKLQKQSIDLKKIEEQKKTLLQNENPYLNYLKNNN